MKKIKKLVAVMLLSLTLFITTFNSYTMAVQAAELVPMTMTVVEALLSLFGLELGLGNQTAFFDNSEFTDFVDAVASGGTVNMPLYGDVNFSDGESLLSWLTWAKNCHSKVAGNELVDVAFDTTVIALSKALDSISYSNTGSAATNTMRTKVDILKDYCNTATDFIGEVQDAFKVASGSYDDKEMTATRWDIITGMLSSFMYGAADVVSGFVDSLVHPDETVYQDYDVMTSEGYTGAYLPFKLPFSNVSFDSGDYSLIGGALPLADTLSPTYYVYNTSTLGDYKLFALYRESDDCYLPYAINSEGKNTSVSILQVYYNLDTLKVESGYINRVQDGSLYLPLFLTVADAFEYFFGDGSIDLVQNYDSTYVDFKDDAATTDDIADMIKQLIGVMPSVDDIAEAMPRVLDKTLDVAGTQNAILSVTAAIADVAGIITDSQEQDNANTNSILSAIGALALNWKDLFKWLDDFWTWLKNAWAELVALIGAAAVAGHPNGSVDSDDSSSSSGSVSLINGLIMLISIFFILLRIFLHLLEFIINVFRIPADPGFITGDFAVGFNYIKSVQLAPLSISIYDFLMGLVHILLLFSVVKVLKKHIDRIHM